MQNLMAKVLKVATVREAGTVEMGGAAKAGETTWMRATEMSMTEGVTGAETVAERTATAASAAGAGALTGAWIKTIGGIGAEEGASTGMLAMSGTTEETTAHPVTAMDLYLIQDMGGK